MERERRGGRGSEGEIRSEGEGEGVEGKGEGEGVEGKGEGEGVEGKGEGEGWAEAVERTDRMSMENETCCGKRRT